MRTFIFFIVLAGCSSVLAQADPAKVSPETGSSSKAPSSGSRDDATKSGSGEEQGSDKDASVLPANDSGRVEKTEQEWKKLLKPEQYRVLRMKGTERPFTNKYDRLFEAGKYVCAACDQELFTSDTKFNSGCGWPAFYAAKAGDRVILTPDLTMGMARTEVTCARCGSHLGHVFDDAPQTPTGQRFCINSVSLKFIPAKSKDADAKVPAKDGKRTKAKKNADEAKKVPQS